MSNLLRSMLFSFCALALAAPSFALPGEGCGGDSVPALTVQEAGEILKTLGTVKQVKPARVRGLYEITLERDGRTAVAYLDYDRKHLIAGEIFELASGKSVGGAAQPKYLDRIDPTLISTGHAVMLGNPKGKTRIFVFTDPDCPFCAQLHWELQKLVTMEPDLVIYVKMFPLRIHPGAFDKARVLLGEHSSVKLLDRAFAGEALPPPGPGDPAQAVEESMKLADSLGISSTPTLVLPDGRVVPGVKSALEIKKLLMW